jgi:hypothetical protein
MDGRSRAAAKGLASGRTKFSYRMGIVKVRLSTPAGRILHRAESTMLSSVRDWRTLMIFIF